MSTLSLRSLLLVLPALLLGSPARGWQEPARKSLFLGELEVWPPVDTVIPTVGVILLEGSESYREQIERAAGRAILEDQGRGVKLNVLQMGPGEHRGTLQVLLKPAVPLQANTEYTLRLSAGEPSYRIYNPRIRQPGGERKPARWKTGPWQDPGATVAPPAIEGEILQVIACRLSDRENGLDLAAKIPGAAEHSLIQVRLHRADTEPGSEAGALTECLSRAWQGGRETSSFRTCSLPEEVRPEKVRIELRPVDAHGTRGAPVSIERPWVG
ncbi:MAG: hypothetical protein P1V51_07420 [Deltaproteobacteria bacterium]|nr:hypothetical protein [Deltaproteobacteria bacterium]